VTPAISGDGTKIVFISNADLGGATNEDRNYEIYLASLPRNSTEVSVSRLTDTGKNNDSEVVKEVINNFAPKINDDGSVITFVSTRSSFKAIDGGPPAFTVQDEGPNGDQTNPNKTPPDGNGEIMLYNVGAKSFSQVTASRDMDARVNFADKGFNTAPIPSGDGRTLVFVSAFNYPGANANKNSDFNGEIFIYKIGDPMNTFTQVTDTTGAAVVPLATILPNLTVFYSLNQNAPMNIMNSVTHPLSSDGSLLTFESAGNFAGGNADKTREVWLYNVNTKAFTQVTNFSLPNSNPAQLTQEQLKKIDFNFMPSINSTGSHISFGSTSNITPASSSSVKTDNADGSREFFRYEIAAQKFRQFTFADKLGGPLEQDTVGQPYIDNTGNAITFSFLANRLATNASQIDDLFQAIIRPVTSNSGIGAAMANAASFKTDMIARGSLVAVFGLQLANNTVVAQSTNLPFALGGVTVTVNGMDARLILVSSGQINMVLPQALANGDNVDFTINNNGVLSTGKITKIVDAAPGVFTATSDGAGRTIAQCARVAPDGLSTLITLPPCSVGTNLQPNSLVVFGTGWRNVSSLQVKIGDQTLTPTFNGAQPDFPGLDQINVTLPKELAEKADLDVSVVVPATTPVESNKSQTSFLPIEVAITMTLNGASFESGTVARGSTAIAQGMNLSNDTVTVPGPNFPTTLNGVTVTVAGLPALISSISPTRVDFILPNNITPADLVEVLINNNGSVSRGRVKVQNVAPGIFTVSGDGAGSAAAKCGKLNPNGSITFTDPPCSVGTEANPNFILVNTTGLRNVELLTFKIGDVELKVIDFSRGGVAPDSTPGLDLIFASLAPALAGKTDVDVIVTAKVGDNTFTSKAGIKVSFTSN
jgi:uncharacterized protein (TIGR03437 family)